MECGGAVSCRNRTGFCTKNVMCRKRNRRVHDQDYDANRRVGRRTARPRKAKRYPAHPWELFEDGIVDEIAIEIAVQGIRHVRLTHAERVAAVRLMLARHYRYQEIERHLGVGRDILNPILSGLGYDAIIDPASGGTRLLITRKDRKRAA